jgi:predicted secreted protein
MTDGMAAYSTLIKKGSTAIAEVNSISGPGLSLDAIEVTHHESTDAWREFVGGLIDGGEITLDLNFLPADATQSLAAGLVADLISRDADTYSIIFPDTSSTEWTFSALVTNFEPSAPVDGKLGASVTLKITGAVAEAGAES